MNPIRTLALTLALLAATAAAQTRTVYFYPPDVDKWISGRSYISNGTKADALTLDPNFGCGWYKVVYEGSNTPPSASQFWLGSSGVDRIGPNGRMENMDDADKSNFTAMGGIFRLADKFSQLGNTIYVVADELDSADQNAGWYGSSPVAANNPDRDNYLDDSRCNFKIAAFIYDTDKSINPSFSDYKDDIDCGGDQYGMWTAGILKNMVKKTLDPNTKKMECDKCGGGKGAFNNENEFKWAFQDFAKGDKSAKNVKLCYDMPFEQQPSGHFEFDSDKLRNDSKKTVGGFFPKLLNDDELSAAAVVEGSSDYSDCPDCRKKRPAESYVNLTKKINPWCFERGYATKNATGEGMSNCGVQYGTVTNATPPYGDFAHGSYPADTWGMTVAGDNNQQGMSADWNGIWRDTTLNMWGDAGCGKSGGETGTHNKGGTCTANQLFCFESHATFMYDPAQEFFFRGDDDIWVFINNELVIDLGGSHLASPGFVQLNTLGLTEGEMYPIDIFFCDRRGGMSNIRVSTNMYVAQKSNFYADPDGRFNHMCVLYQGGADCSSRMSSAETSGENDWCGEDLIKNGFKVDFFMIDKAKRDTIWLSEKPSYAKNGDRAKDCSGTGNEFVCFGSGNGKGIEVKEAVYQCGGYKQCKGNSSATANVNLIGNYSVYARLVGTNGQPSESSKSVLIDSFKSASNTHIVWGDLESEFDGSKAVLNDAYDKKTTRDQKIIAGKRTPIYIASGSGWDNDYTIFSYDNDPDFAGKSYTLLISPAGLKTYDSEGNEKRGGVLGKSGIDTIWVEGGYDLENNTKFTLNVVAESDDAPSMTLTIYQPELKFVEKDFKTTIGNPTGYTKWTDGAEAPPYVGKPLDMYVVAWDGGRDEICGHCTFPLSETSRSEGACADKVVNKNPLVDAISPPVIRGGKLEVNIHGNEDTGDNKCTAAWKITGLNPDVNVEWTGLRFREPPVPIPMESYIADRNGDGIGDSVYVKFTKSLATVDSLLPVLLEVVWAAGDTVSYYHPDLDLSKLKNDDYVKSIFNKDFYTKNRAYWNEFVHDSTIIITSNPSKTGQASFSKEILTFGKGLVLSRIPFVDCTVGCAFTYGENNTGLIDRISPIVVAAKYDYVTAGCVPGGDKNSGCSEMITVTLSERVYKAEGSAADAYMNPFDYCLGSQSNRDCPSSMEDADRYNVGWNDHLKWSWELPQGDNIATIARYNSSGTNSGLTNGDSVAYLTYKSFNVGVELNPTPKPEDWVKVRFPAEGDVFMDAEGNVANKNERGVKITGSKPSTRQIIRIASVGGPDSKPIGGVFEKDSPCRQSEDCGPYWFDDKAQERAEGLFEVGKIAEILPIASVHPDSVSRYYPGSVGAIFDVSSDLKKEVSGIIEACGGKCKGADGQPLSEGNIAQGISVNASAYYHTNLGDYTAHRDNFAVPCDDPIFRRKDIGGNCYSNSFNFYLPWDLKANNNRSVGAGAYVGISKFFMQITWTDENGATQTRKILPQEFIEMYGARRTPKAK